MENPIGVQDAIDLFRETNYPKELYANVDNQESLVPGGFDKRLIYVDFIRNYGQLSGPPVEDPDAVDNYNFTEYFLEHVGEEYKQIGRLRDDKQQFTFYPIKHLDEQGKPTKIPKKADKQYDLYLTNVPTIPVTDENDAEKRSFTPLRDDYIFIVYPKYTLRGVRPFDYMRFKTPTYPPCLETRGMPDNYQPDDPIESEQAFKNINIVRSGMPPVNGKPQQQMPIFHRPKYYRDAEGQTIKEQISSVPGKTEPCLLREGFNELPDDYKTNTAFKCARKKYVIDYDPDKTGYDGGTYWKGDYNWESYTFWQITRILDVPRGFQAFFTRGLSRIY